MVKADEVTDPGSSGGRGGQLALPPRRKYQKRTGLPAQQGVALLTGYERDVNELIDAFAEQVQAGWSAHGCRMSLLHGLRCAWRRPACWPVPGQTRLLSRQQAAARAARRC